jgi:hypothetical protein
MKKTYLPLLIILSLLFLLFTPFKIEFANNTITLTNPLRAQSTISLNNPLRAQSFEELVVNIVNFILTLAIPIVVLMIIIGGFYFVTAAGETSKITTGKNIILWSMIGFIIILLAKGLIAAIKEIFGISP